MVLWDVFLGGIWWSKTNIKLKKVRPLDCVLASGIAYALLAIDGCQWTTARPFPRFSDSPWPCMWLSRKDVGSLLHSVCLKNYGAYKDKQQQASRVSYFGLVEWDLCWRNNMCMSHLHTYSTYIYIYIYALIYIHARSHLWAPCFRGANWTLTNGWWRRPRSVCACVSIIQDTGHNQR